MPVEIYVKVKNNNSNKKKKNQENSVVRVVRQAKMSVTHGFSS